MKETKEIKEKPKRLEYEGQTDLRICNLVSQGKTLSEAREQIAKTDGNLGEKEVAPTRTNLLGLPTNCPDSKEGLLNHLSVAGKPQHPGTPVEKLISIYRKEFIDEDKD